MLKTESKMTFGSSVEVSSGDHHTVKIQHIYHVECWRDGELIWSDTFHNLVTTAGLNKYLDATLKTGLAAPVWFVGLITGPGAGNVYVIADTSAAHPGWVESVAYADATRRTWTPGAVAAGSVDNTAAKAIFSINATTTIAGCFMIDVNTKGGVTGVLLGEGNFTTGDRLVQSGDTLNVAVTATQT